MITDLNTKEEIEAFLWKQKKVYMHELVIKTYNIADDTVKIPISLLSELMDIIDTERLENLIL